MNHWIDRARPLRHTLESLPITPQGGGILLSEMLLFLTVAFDRGVTKVVESGRKAGYSTEIIHSFHDRLPLTSIEISPNPDEEPRVRASCPHAQLLVGNGTVEVPHHIKGRTALLLDGPKGYGAYELFQSCRHRVVFAAIHDVCKLDHGGQANEFRALLERDEPEALFSDDETWLAEFAEMDRPYWSYGDNYRSREEMTRCSFTLAILKGGLWQTTERN